jgi:hypothetical protein
MLFMVTERFGDNDHAALARLGANHPRGAGSGLGQTEKMSTRRGGSAFERFTDIECRPLHF